MAKKQKREVVRIKWMGLACFAIAVLLFALAIWGSSLVSAKENNVFGYTVEHFSNPENIIATFQDAIAVRIISFFMIMFISVLALIATFKMLFMFFNVLGFIGRKDAYKTAKKLSMFAKRAFATIGLEITALLIFTLDDGVITKQISTFFTVVGVAFAVLYLGIRAYRWLLAEKLPILDMVFIFVKDALFIGCLVFMASLIDTKLLANVMLLETLFNLPETSNLLSQMPYMHLMDMIIGFIHFLVVTSLMRKTLRYFIFNNYKKSAYKKYLGGYITLLVFVIIFAALKEIIFPLINQDIASIQVVSVVTTVLTTIIPYLAVIIAIGLAGSIEGGYVTEPKLYIPCVKPIANAEEVNAESEEVLVESENQVKQVEETLEEQVEETVEEQVEAPAPKKRGRKAKTVEETVENND